MHEYSKNVFIDASTLLHGWARVIKGYSFLQAFRTVRMDGDARTGGSSRKGSPESRRREHFLSLSPFCLSPSLLLFFTLLPCVLHSFGPGSLLTGRGLACFLSAALLNSSPSSPAVPSFQIAGGGLWIGVVTSRDLDERRRHRQTGRLVTVERRSRSAFSVVI